MDPLILLTNTQTADWFLNLAFHSLVVLAVGWLASKICRGFSAPVRSGISLSTMTVLILLPFCSLVLQPRKIRLFEPAKMPVVQANAAYPGKTIVSPPPGSETFPGRKAAAAGNPVNAMQTGGDYIKKPPLFNISRAGVVKVVNGSGFIWLAGFLLIICRMLFGMVRLLRFRSGLIKVRDPRLEKILPVLRASFKGTKFPPLYISLDIGSPVTIGFMNPSIIISHDLYQRVSIEELRSILLHEMSHIHHHDQVFGIVQGVAIALYWWNPLVYVISREFSRTREYISDNYAIRGNDPLRYARCLVNVAKKTNLRGLLPTVVSMAAPQISLEERIKSIISKERIMKTKLKKTITCLFVFCSFLLAIFIVGNSWTFALEMSREAEQTREIVGNTVSSSQPASVEEMHRAIKEGDTGEINRLLQEKPGLLDAKNKNGLTPLFWSLDLGLGDVAKFLIEKGADVRFRGFRSRTILHMAARAGDSDVIKILLEKGVEVNVRDSRGETPLHLLCRSRDESVESAQLLIEKGADVNIKDNKALTPLTLTMNWGHIKISRLLIEKGADVNVKIPGKRYLVRETDDGYQLEINGKNIYTFDRALFAEGSDIPEEEIKKMVSLVSVVLMDSEVFYRAVAELDGRPDEQIIEKILSLSPVKKRGKKAFYKLKINGKVDSLVTKEHLNKKSLEKVLKRMCEVNENLLNTAIIKGHRDLAGLMIEKGADINAVDRKGNRPLFYAKKYGRREIIDLLTSKGAK